MSTFLAEHDSGQWVLEPGRYGDSASAHVPEAALCDGKQRRVDYGRMQPLDALIVCRPLPELDYLPPS